MKRLLLLLFVLLTARTLSADFAGYCSNAVPPCFSDDPKSACYVPPEPPAKCEPRLCDKCTKSPCYVGSGVYVSDAQDLKIATTGIPIEVSRHYQSTHAVDGGTGYGWVSSLSSRLVYSVFLQSAPSSYQREADIRTPEGGLYRFVENTDGSFTPPAGRFDTLVHNADGTWDLWLQRSRSHMHFSQTGNLLQLFDDFGNTQSWTYVNDRLTRIDDTSGSGRYIDITWGADGRISDVTDMTGRNVHYAYDSRGVMVSSTNAAAQTTSYTYTSGRFVPLLSAVTDAWGRNITSIVYDPQDRVHSYTDRGETYTYTYNYNNSVTTTGKSDSSGNLWQFRFGPGGVVTDSIPPGGGAGEHDDYDANGLVQLHIDPAGVKTYTTYNAQGNPLTVTRDYQGATAVEWRYAYDPAFPDQAVSITPYTPGTNTVHTGWQTRKFDYYAAGSAAPGAVYHVYEVESDGATSHVVRTYTYDTHGRVLTDTTASGAVRTYVYDSSGNLARSEHPPNNDGGTRPAMTFTYDALGRRLTSTDPLGRTTAYTWDALDRLLTITRPAVGTAPSFVTTFTYDQYDSASQTLVKTVVDANGRTTRYATDTWGRIVQTTDTLGNSVRYTFTKGLLTAKTDENNYVTRYAWDALRRLATINYPDGTNEQYTYLADSSVATFRNRSAQTTTLTWDRHKRPLSQSDPSGAATWTYDGQKVVAVSDTHASPAETLTTTWNASFRIASEAEGTRGTVSYTYTAEGRVATESVAGGATTAYDYYPDGAVRNLTWSPVSGNFHYDYALDGGVAAITFPNGQTRSYAYDALGRPTQVANVHPGAGNLATFGYGYDTDAFTGQPSKPGLRTQITTDFPALSLAGAITKLDYDARGRLIRADYPSAVPYGGTTASWTWDAAGNRTSATTNGVTASYTYAMYSANPLNATELLSDGSNSYTYDARGNTIARSGAAGNATFAWDINNRLVSISGSQAASYTYDVIGRRTSKTTGGATTTYLYSGMNLVAESGAATASYLHGQGIDQPLAMMRGGTVYYFDVDALGSVVAVNDSSGAVRNSYAWDAWGGAVAKNETVANPFGFTARESGEAGLAYYRNRYYEPATGTFRSVDPSVSLLGYGMASGKTAQAAQLPDYAYASDAPTMFSDPYGFSSCDECYDAYRDDTQECGWQLRYGGKICAGGFALCMIVTKDIRDCGLAFIACVIAIDTAYDHCMDVANRKLQKCLKGCDMCPTPPPPPPPQYTPVPPPIKDPVPWSSIQ